jgi:hypothetical protein
MGDDLTKAFADTEKLRIAGHAANAELMNHWREVHANSVNQYD